jgi:hypothetical protein
MGMQWRDMEVKGEDAIREKFNAVSEHFIYSPQRKIAKEKNSAPF